VERYGRTDGGEPTRLLLPVGGLVLNQQWDSVTSGFILPVLPPG
jgi:hypothetical protein